MFNNTINNTIFEKKHHYMIVLREVETLKRQMEYEALNDSLSKRRLKEITQTWNFVFAGLLQEGQQFQYIKNANDSEKDVIRLTIDNVDYDCLTSVLKTILEDDYYDVLGLEKPKDSTEDKKQKKENTEKENVEIIKELREETKTKQKKEADKEENVEQKNVKNTDSIDNVNISVKKTPVEETTVDLHHKTDPMIYNTSHDSTEEKDSNKTISSKILILKKVGKFIGYIFEHVFELIKPLFIHPIRTALVIATLIILPKFYEDKLADAFVYYKSLDFDSVVYNSKMKDSYKLVEMEVGKFVEVINGHTIKVLLEGEEKVVTLIGLSTSENEQAAIDFLNKELQSGDSVYMLKDDYDKNQELPTFMDDNGYLLRIVMTKAPDYKFAAINYPTESLNYKMLDEEIAVLNLDNVYQNGGYASMFKTVWKYNGNSVN